MEVENDHPEFPMEIDQSKEKCKVCKKEFKSVLVHLARSGCKKGYSDHEREMMKIQKKEKADKMYELRNKDERNQKKRDKYHADPTKKV